MTDRETIRQTLVGFLESETGEQVAALEDGKKLREELGLDSVDVVSTVMQIERHFRIRLEHQELESLVNVGELLNLIQAKVAAVEANPAAGPTPAPESASSIA
ncbi:MAG: acyl carrier protein [Planctomycetes bacterium]|nr:acyl carrier protein [Planctomycetota bacterium]